MSELVIGLTGGIGSGKTLVSDLFAKRGIEIIDADIIARQVVEPGEQALKQISDKFGPEIVNTQQQLDRKALREKVFSDPDLKLWLDNLLHPLIRKRMVEQTQQATSPYCILAVPLLVENGMNAMVDRVLVVDVEEDRQLNRAAARDEQSREQISKIMEVQATRAQRLAIADDVIDNNHSPEETERQVEKLHKGYLEALKK